MTETTTLDGALDALVHAAADAPDTRWTVTALAVAVTELEHAVGAELGASDGDVLVVLQRRLGRVHRRASVHPGTLTAATVAAHLAALGAPSPRPPVREPSAQPVDPAAVASSDRARSASSSASSRSARTQCSS